MALIVEDGTGIVNADSYGTRAGFIAHAANYYGVAVDDVDASDVPMRAAFAYLNGLNWDGSKTHGRNQAGALPREDLEDCDGIDIGDTEIPSEAILAQYDLAYVEFTAPGTLSPSGSIRDSLISKEKVDVIEVQYDTSKIVPGDDVNAVRVDAAMRRISCFIVDSSVRGVGYVVTV